MEYNKINNLLRSEELGSAIDSESENLSKFVPRQYVRVNSLSNMYDNQLDLNTHVKVRFMRLFCVHLS